MRKFQHAFVFPCEQLASAKAIRLSGAFPRHFDLSGLSRLLVDVEDRRVDVALRYLPCASSGFYSERLLSEPLVVVEALSFLPKDPLAPMCIAQFPKLQDQCHPYRDECAKAGGLFEPNTQSKS